MCCLSTRVASWAVSWLCIVAAHTRPSSSAQSNLMVPWMRRSDLDRPGEILWPPWVGHRAVHAVLACYACTSPPACTRPPLLAPVPPLRLYLPDTCLGDPVLAPCVQHCLCLCPGHHLCQHARDMLADRDPMPCWVGSAVRRPLLLLGVGVAGGWLVVGGNRASGPCRCMRLRGAQDVVQVWTHGRELK